MLIVDGDDELPMIMMIMMVMIIIVITLTTPSSTAPSRELPFPLAERHLDRADLALLETQSSGHHPL